MSPKPRSRPTPRAASELSIKIGRWAEASATGWGVAALVILAVVGAVLILVVGPVWLH